MVFYWTFNSSLLFDMIRPEIKILTKQSENYPLYYESATSSRIFITVGGIVAEFTVKMVCVSYRNPEQYLTLITEDGNPIITQSGQLIDIG